MEKPVKILIVSIAVVAVLGILVLVGRGLVSSPAALTVLSDPSGEKVLLDGKEVGVTPFSGKDFKEGEITLSFGGFSQKVKLTGGGETVVNWVLGPVEGFSAGEVVWLTPSSTGTELLVISKPAAEVFLNEESLGSAPLSKTISPGEYRLEIRKESFFSRTLAVVVREGYRLNVSATLSLDPFPVEEKELDAGGNQLRVFDLSSSEPLLLVDYSNWVGGASFWAQKKEIVYHYFLTATGALYDSQGSEVALTSLEEQEETVSVGYLGESGAGLSTAASETLSSLQEILFPAPVVKKVKVLILETGVGFLRVRSGPGVSYSEIGRAIPGRKYDYLGQSGEWFKIKFGTREGWVSKEYSRKVTVTN
jgi:hypothetical protein